MSAAANGTPATPAGGSRWDVPALRAGGSVALAMAAPLTILARVLNDRADDRGTDSGAAPWLAVLALGFFVIGAGVAAWQQDRGTPLSHGIVAAGSAFVIAQAVFLLYKVTFGDGAVQWLRIAVNLTLTLVAGTLGGFLGSFLQRNGVRSQYRR